MSLITRCPTCETMFRVVPDQLRVSEGWVRCGQCAEVFDATQNMVPSGDDAAATPPTAPRPTSNTPPPAAPAAAPAPPRPASSAPPPPPPAAPATTTPATAAPVPGAPDAAPDENRFTPSPAPADRAAAPHDDAFDVGATMRPAIDTALEDDWRDGPPTDPQTAIDTPYDADADDTDTLPPPELDFPPVPEPARDTATDEPRSTGVGAGTDAPRADAAVPRPSFLQDEQAPSIWRRPMVRLALVITLVVLLALLGVQLLVKERDRVAAAQPGMRPVLEALCTVAGCSIAPLRQIESIVIDSSSFSRVRGDDYRLGFSLKNTAPIDVAMPAVELSLTDPQDQPVIRRVILPAEFGARSDALAGESVWTGSLALTVQADASAQRVAGYRLLAFYP
ncbi:MAG: DUF3426 domain-containing protein [Rhodoferax sp.]|nr:DUF3426 domain-containing protein [Rhodoferax sp.]